MKCRRVGTCKGQLLRHGDDRGISHGGQRLGWQGLRPVRVHHLAAEVATEGAAALRFSSSSASVGDGGSS